MTEQDEQVSRQLKAGDQIDSFQIISLIGADEVCHLYHAHDALLDVPVFLREFHPVRLVATRKADHALSITKNTAFNAALGEFIQTARDLARVHTRSGEQIQRYFAAGNTGYTVSDYFQGQTLLDKINRFGRMHEREVIEVFTPILQSMQAYHEAGIVHADLSPDRILIHSHRPPLVMGFMQRLLALISPDHYAAPEHWAGLKTCHPRADIYALGAMMYFALSGLHVLSAQTRQEALKQGKPDPQPMAARMDGIQANSRIMTMIDHCLDLRPDRRPETAGLLLDAFRESSGVRIEGSLSVKTKAQELSQRDHVAVSNLPVQQRDAVSKVVITGTTGAGKTSLIARLADETFTPRQANIGHSLANDHAQSARIDQACMHLPEGDRLFLYGVPGPLGFESSWELVEKGTVGIVLLLDTTRKDPQRDLEHFLARLDGEQCPPLVIGMTKTEQSRTPSIRDINATVDQFADRFPQRPAVFTLNPSSRDHAWLTIETLLTMQLTQVPEAQQTA